jgi:hypothetical protein
MNQVKKKITITWEKKRALIIYIKTNDVTQW